MLQTDHTVYLGSFLNTSGRLILADPYDTAFIQSCIKSSLPEGGPPLQMELPFLKGNLIGLYVLEKGVFHSLLLLHEVLWKEGLRNPTFFPCLCKTLSLRAPLGQISFHYSHMGVLVDQAFYQQNNYAMFDIEPDALYSAKDLLSLLNQEPFAIPNSHSSGLRQYLKDRVTMDGIATGETLIDVFPEDITWNGFRKVPSTHWYCDIKERIGAEGGMFPGGLGFFRRNYEDFPVHCISLSDCRKQFPLSCPDYYDQVSSYNDDSSICALQLIF